MPLVCVRIHEYAHAYMSMRMHNAQKHSFKAGNKQQLNKT